MSDIKDSKAVIVGGTHGIGLATAQLLISKGSQVIITGRNPENLQSASHQLRDTATVHRCDITSLEAINDLSEKIKQRFGSDAQLDLLFLNAGYARLEPFTAVTESSFHRTFSTNVFGTFFAAQTLAPLVKPGGAIVFTTSIANRRGIPGMAIYSASKAAVHSLAQTLAAELADRNVRVSAVSPGFIKTPTMGVADAGREEIEEFEKFGAQQTPMGRVGAAEEVARAVVYLAFEATFTTGKEIVVDGGLASVEKEH
ncbi:hypothetical protein BDV95DRAFT_627909 [Massariosphaeria phaeospora]|uniref:Ketoreductase domain-containing protein n=1 Tax=Massariosphaeria phaeospora TaxID=100035 RepID=A0A7C8ID17_9PLEO|nr:hypothetical protein BDV95DRAFT_627909 [Massariosphaeria phaeospora]